MLNRLSQHKTETGLLACLILAACLLIVGLVTPLMTIKTLIFMRNSFSVVTGVYDLWNDGKYFLFFVITLFSVVLPILKIVFLAIFLTRRIVELPVNHKFIEIMHDYGRWAMLDVLVVAVLLVTVKLGAIASVEVHEGLYIFGSAVLLTMFITDRALKLKMNNE